jgi:hypothetical protein
MNSRNESSRIALHGCASRNAHATAVPRWLDGGSGKGTHRRFRRTAWLLPVLALLALSGTAAQDAPLEDDSEDVIVLTPFCVTASEDTGYASSQTRSPAQPRFRGGETMDRPNVPIALIRRADAVVIEFALSNSADKQERRNEELTESVEAVAKAIKNVSGLRFENREVQLLSGNRQRSIIGKGGVVTSFANFAVFAEMDSETRLFERVKQVRGIVSAARLAGGTKAIDGPVGLFVRRPDESRKELLAKIFEDLETVRKGLGGDFEVLVSGLAGPVRVRSCSENEVELWIDYSFVVRSVREIEARKEERR